MQLLWHTPGGVVQDHNGSMWPSALKPGHATGDCSSSPLSCLLIEVGSGAISAAPLPQGERQGGAEDVSGLSPASTLLEHPGTKRFHS